MYVCDCVHTREQESSCLYIHKSRTVCAYVNVCVCVYVYTQEQKAVYVCAVQYQAPSSLLFEAGFLIGLLRLG